MKYYQKLYADLIDTHIMISFELLQVFISINGSSLIVFMAKLTDFMQKRNISLSFIAQGGSNTKLKGFRGFYCS